MRIYSTIDKNVYQFEVEFFNNTLFIKIKGQSVWAFNKEEVVANKKQFIKLGAIIGSVIQDDEVGKRKRKGKK